MFAAYLSLILRERKSLEERKPRRGWECTVYGHGMHWGKGLLFVC